MASHLFATSSFNVQTALNLSGTPGLPALHELNHVLQSLRDVTLSLDEVCDLVQGFPGPGGRVWFRAKS